MSIRRFLRIFTPGPWRYRAQRASEVIRGVDFMRIIEAHEVGLDPALAVHSSPSGNRYLIRALEAMSITPADRILDIGCGKGSAMSAPVAESVYTASADSGSTSRSDAAAQQYIYNWKTGAGGNYWRIGVTFDDGQTYYVNIGLR